MSSQIEFALGSESLVRAELHHAHHVARGEHHDGTPPLSIAISREIGAFGAVIAREAAKRLGWSLYDRELIERVAQELHVPVNRLEAVDERHVGLLQECALLLSKSSVSESTYVSHLVNAIVALGKQGCCVIVGRGAAQLLPPRYTLRVRLVAPLEQRAMAIAQERGCTYQQAERFARESDQHQQRFVKDHFNRDVGDVRNYDLVLNTSRWSVEQCVDMIVEAFGALRSMREATAKRAAISS